MMDYDMQQGGASSTVESTPASAQDEKPSTQESPSQTQQSPVQSSNGKASKHLNTLEYLDKQHQHLRGVEQSIQKYLIDLQKEEQSLREALVQSSTTLKEQRQSEMRKKEAEALARLEEALMNDDDSDSTAS